MLQCSCEGAGRVSKVALDSIEDNRLRGIAVEFAGEEEVEAVDCRLEVLIYRSKESAVHEKSLLSVLHRYLSEYLQLWLVCLTFAAGDAGLEVLLRQSRIS